jgi:hypothetical protein
MRNVAKALAGSENAREAKAIISQLRGFRTLEEQRRPARDPRRGNRAGRLAAAPALPGLTDDTALLDRTYKVTAVC